MVNKLRRALSITLTAALVLTLPGPQAWSAVATRVSVNAPVSAQTGIHGAAGSVVPGQSLALPKSALTLTGATLSAPVTPALAPSVMPSAKASAAQTAAASVPSVQASASLSKPGEVSKPAAAPRQVDPELGAPAASPAAVETAAPAQESASGEVKSAVEQGRMAQPSSKIASGLAALKRAFGLKKSESAPETSGSAVETAQASGSSSKSGLSKASETAETKAGENQPPVPPSNDDKKGDDGDGKGWFGLGKSAVMFIAALLVAQVGVESLGSAMPALVQKTFGDFTVVAQLAIFASIAGIIGRQIGSVVVKKLGLRKTYLGATLIRLMSISALCALLATGNMTLPLMMAFYSVNGLLGGIAITAESSIPPALVGSDQAKIEKFWTWEQTLLEILGVTGPIATGAVVAAMGFLPALIAFPVSFAISLAIMAIFLKIPQKVEAMRMADLEKAKSEGKEITLKNVFGEFFRKVAHGAKLVWNDKVLRYSFLGYTAYMLLNPFLYSMLAPAFGLRLVGAENSELAASVYGWLTGFYSLGGLLGGLVMIFEQKKIGKMGMTPEQESEYLRKSMFKWMKWGAVGLAAMLTLAFPIPMLGSLITLPSFLGWASTLTVPALALIPFGIAQVISVVKLKSFFQSRVKNPQDMPDAMGFFGSASLAVSTLGLLALKYLFKGVAGFTPFYIIAALMVPLAIYYLRIIRNLNKASAPTSPEKPAEKK